MDLRAVVPQGRVEGGPGGPGASRPVPTADELHIISAKKVLTIAEVMAETGRCRETIRRAIRSGALPAKRWGNRVAIRRADLEAFIEGLPAA